jgi:hypothetical protein
MATPTNPTPTTPKVFISYSCADRIATQALATSLRKHHVRTFLYCDDREGFEPGQMLPEVILQELGWCDVCLVVWSGLTAVSDWVSREIQIALDFDKAILSYQLDKTPLPPEIASLPSIIAADTGAQSELLRLIYGDSPIPQPSIPEEIHLEPGLWHIDISDILQTTTLKLQIQEDGSLSGQREQGNITGQVTGEWRYDQSENLLTMKLESRVGLRPNHEILRVRLTQQQDRVLSGEDMYALGPVLYHYTLHPVQ